MADIPSIRWGIIGTGLISSWFVHDLITERSDVQVKHFVQAIGTSSLQKGKEFTAKHCPRASPTVYESYDRVYNDPNVDIIYIGTPHAFHKKNCLDAIAAGKAVLCEKAFALNSREAKEVFEAAKEKNVYVHEAMWLRHRPLVKELQRLVHQEKEIGEVIRAFADFGLDLDISSMPETSRYKDLTLGAGSLLDVGVYSLTWAVLALDSSSPGKSERPKIFATQTFEDGVEVMSSALLHYESTGRQGVVTCTTKINRGPGVVARIDGTNGYIEIQGLGGSFPQSFTVYKKRSEGPTKGQPNEFEGKKYEFNDGNCYGFHYEADSTALDVLAGRKENAVMPWSETIHILEMMDEIRKQGGTKYPVD